MRGLCAGALVEHSEVAIGMSRGAPSDEQATSAEASSSRSLHEDGGRDDAYRRDRRGTEWFGEGVQIMRGA